MHEAFFIVKEESFVFKTLLLITYTIRIFVINLPRFHEYHLSLDTLLNKVFEPKHEPKL